MAGRSLRCPLGTSASSLPTAQAKRVQAAFGEKFPLSLVLPLRLTVKVDNPANFVRRKEETKVRKGWKWHTEFRLVSLGGEVEAPGRRDACLAAVLEAHLPREVQTAPSLSLLLPQVKVSEMARGAQTLGDGLDLVHEGHTLRDG